MSALRDPIRILIASYFTGGPKAKPMAEAVYDLVAPTEELYATSLQALAAARDVAHEATERAEKAEAERDDATAAMERVRKDWNALLHPNGGGPARPLFCDLLSFTAGDLRKAADRATACLTQAEKAEREAAKERALRERLHDAITRGGFDLSPCGFCSALVCCIPDGLPCCEDCSEKEGKRQAGAADPHTRHDPEVERVAMEIYRLMPGPDEGKPQWVPHGNSLKQDECRAQARKQLATAKGGGA